ncbi:MAG: VOC family protein, partial [Cellulosimicrobium funkei]
ADVAALVADGATLVGEHTIPGYRWAVLADPQGNQFCVGAPEEPTSVG